MGFILIPLSTVCLLVTLSEENCMLTFIHQERLHSSCYSFIARVLRGYGCFFPFVHRSTMTKAWPLEYIIIVCCLQAFFCFLNEIETEAIAWQVGFQCYGTKMVKPIFGTVVQIWLINDYIYFEYMPTRHAVLQ